VLPFVAQVHGRLAIALILFAAVLGLLGAFQLLTRRRLSGGFRSGYLLLWGLTLVQGALGAGTYIGGARPHPLHFVYGIFAALFLPGVYFFAARRASDTEATLLTLACWTVCIAYGRGIMTGA
jgi:CDP-diglyceride synthetase